MWYQLLIFSLLYLACNSQYQFTCRNENDSISSAINELRGQINELCQQVNAAQAGFKSLGDGWVTIFNGYQYKKTPGAQSWEASQSICQRWGGDLAVYGVQDMGSRRLLLRILSIQATSVWIGLNDKQREGTWVWVNGDTAVVPGAVLWRSGEPNDRSEHEDCGEIVARNGWGYGTNDLLCSKSRVAVCEKIHTVRV